MVGLPLVLGLAGLEGCSCRPTLPPDPGDQTHHDTSSDTAAHTGDTGPVSKPCDAPEEEPNDTIDTPNALPMEKHGCGLIDEAGDQDFWAFTLSHDSWLEIRVGHSNGSIADMSFVLTPSDQSWLATRPDDAESLDSTLIFPASAGDYKLGVNEETLKGGDRYGYDVLVSEAKPPVEFTKTEPQPDDDSSDDKAIPLAFGDRIYGTMDGNNALEDLDWYLVTIPSGRHTLDVTVEAFNQGSSADTTVRLYADDGHTSLPLGCREDPCSGTNCCSITGGATGGDYDPQGDYSTIGPENVYVVVSEAFGREGPADWYVLDVELK